MLALGRSGAESSLETNMNMMAVKRVLTFPVLFVAVLTTFAAAQETTKQGPDELAKTGVLKLVRPAASVANKGESRVDESVLSANKALIRRLFEEEINQKNLTAMESMVADGYVNHNDSVGPTSDIKQGEKFLAAVFAAFPDMHVTIEDMIAEGDKVVVRNTWRGTFRGPWMGIPATGKEVTFTGIVIWKINNGKITDRWANINFNEVLQQLANGPSKAHKAQQYAFVRPANGNLLSPATTVAEWASR